MATKEAEMNLQTLRDILSALREMPMRLRGSERQSGGEGITGITPGGTLRPIGTQVTSIERVGFALGQIAPVFGHLAQFSFNLREIKNSFVNLFSNIFGGKKPVLQGTTGGRDQWGAKSLGSDTKGIMSVKIVDPIPLPVTGPTDVELDQSINAPHEDITNTYRGAGAGRSGNRTSGSTAPTPPFNPSLPHEADWRTSPPPSRPGKDGILKVISTPPSGPLRQSQAVPSSTGDGFWGSLWGAVGGSVLARVLAPVLGPASVGVGVAAPITAAVIYATEKADEISTDTIKTKNEIARRHVKENTERRAQGLPPKPNPLANDLKGTPPHRGHATGIPGLFDWMTDTIWEGVRTK